MAKAKHAAPVKKGFPVWAWLTIAAAVLVAVFAITQLRQPAGARPANYPAEITVSQAAEKRNQGAFILDVRQPEEWVDGHIPGSTLIPLAELESRVAEVPADKEVVVVCRSGNRSATGRDILKKAGLVEVTSMAGGVTQWKAQGLPIETGQ